VDSQWLRAKLRAARQDREQGKAPRNARELYRWLHDVLQSDQHTTPDEFEQSDQD
jgi:ribosomal 50S subunit-associated protein YjgA (DUF615 family)